MNNERMMQERRERDARLFAAHIGRGGQSRDDEQYRESVSFIRGHEAIEPGEVVAGLWRFTHRGRQQDTSKAEQQAAILERVRERRGRVGVWLGSAGVRANSEEWLRRLDKVFARVAWWGFKKVVVSELSRLIRSLDYGTNQRARPRPEQRLRLRRLAEKYGLTIICVCPPDADLSQERSYQTRRSGCCGRPAGTRNKRPGWCKERRALAEKVALEAVEAGKSCREAARMANEAMRAAGCFIRPISYETVRQWHLRRQRRGEGV